MLDSMLMFFFSFNPIICGLLLASGAMIAMHHTSSQATPVDVSNITVLRRQRAANEVRQAGRQ